MTRTGELFCSSPPSILAERDGQTDDGVLERARFGGWGRVLQNKGWLAFLRESVGRHEKLGHHRLESVAFEPAKFARPSTPRPRSPAKTLVSKLGIIRRQMMGHLKFWRGSPYPPRPFRSEDGGMMRAEEGGKGRTRDPENGQSWGSRKREKEEGRKATVKIF